MKYIHIAIAYLFMGCGLQGNSSLNEMNQLCVDYTTYFQNSEFKHKEVIMRLREEEFEDGRYTAYRVAAEQAYLPEGLIPDRVAKTNGYIVMFFLINEADSVQKRNIKNDLMNMNLYSEMAYQYTTNYPEWVMVIDNYNKSSRLIKDAWYKPLRDLIK